MQVNQAPRLVRADSIKVGECFEVAGIVFLRVKIHDAIAKEDDTYIQTCNLVTGFVAYTARGEMVTPVTATVEVK
jgi:hypothetical protein